MNTLIAILRGAAIALAILFGLAVVLAAPAAARGTDPAARATSRAALERQVLAAMNEVRAEHGLEPLRPSRRLVSAADEHSRAMAAAGFFHHDSADGSAFWQRIRRWYPKASFRYWAVGENLLWSAPDVDAAKAVQLWMNSPSHRKNLLTPGWREVGLAAIHVETAPGAFGGREVTIVTADFGVRR